LLITSSLFGLTVLIYSTAEAVKTINYTVQKNIEFENIRDEFLKEFKESRREVEERVLLFVAYYYLYCVMKVRKNENIDIG
jgi:hypothetical protein